MALLAPRPPPRRLPHAQSRQPPLRCEMRRPLRAPARRYRDRGAARAAFHPTVCMRFTAGRDSAAQLPEEPQRRRWGRYRPRVRRKRPRVPRGRPRRPRALHSTMRFTLARYSHRLPRASSALARRPLLPRRSERAALTPFISTTAARSLRRRREPTTPHSLSLLRRRELITLLSAEAVRWARRARRSHTTRSGAVVALEYQRRHRRLRGRATTADSRHGWWWLMALEGGAIATRPCALHRSSGDAARWVALRLWRMRMRAAERAGRNAATLSRSLLHSPSRCSSCYRPTLRRLSRCPCPRRCRCEERGRAALGARPCRAVDSNALACRRLLCTVIMHLLYIITCI